MIRALLLLLLVLGAAPARADTLDVVRARGTLICGMQADNPPFSLPDREGVWRGMDVDSCRAIAAAVLGDASRITVRPVTGLTRFPAVQNGEVDVLFGSTTWLATREGALGLLFAGANYFSGQGFLVRRSLGVSGIRGLDGATVCVPPGSSTEVILQDWFRRNNLRFQPVVIDDPAQIQATFLSGRCDAYTRDMTALSGFRLRQANPDEFVLLPDAITMEPLGAFVRKGDDRWFDVVRWAGLALVWAEALGVDQAGVNAAAVGNSPDAKRLLGTEGNVGESFGLDRAWAANALRAVGNYGEMWQRNVAPMGIARGLNAQWDHGGLMYAPPLR